ncbi:hypothetical protein RUND412_000286 [Rhizina undulata]
MASAAVPGTKDDLTFIPLAYNPANSQSSATHLVYALFPEWTPAKGGRGIQFVRFTDGITNTLLKCIHKAPEGLPPKEAKNYEDENSVLLRAYGRDTNILIDRERECSSHLLLSRFNLAPPLLGRFSNGLLYRFVAGRVCGVRDMSKPEVWQGVAARLGEWHGVLPTTSTEPLESSSSLWEVLEMWIAALPTNTDTEKARKDLLQGELEKLQSEKEKGGYGLKGQDGGVGLIMGHCDLLSGNVIILPEENAATVAPGAPKKVHFIDYEYATPCERAFDIANHFAEWGGFDCDYSLLPTKSTRREFIRQYLASFHQHRGDALFKEAQEVEVEALMEEVDLFRAVPGFYWGIWALIQATISQIDFDYAAYAEVRLGEYWAWKAEFEGVREGEVSVREARWAEE